MKQGHLERNMVQLALLLTVQQISSERTSFTRHILQGETAFHETRLICQAQGGHVVPHGLDNDVYAALTSLFVDQGMPETGVIVTTAHGLMVMAGMTVSAPAVQAVHESLERMRNADYKILESWYDGRSRTRLSQSFHLLAAVMTLTRNEAPEEFRDLRADTLLRIQLPDPIVQSIRNGYTRTFNLELYQSIRNVLGRGLYRVLDSLRSMDGQVQRSITLPLLSWGEYLGYETLTASKLRSRLALAHEELRKHGYVQGVEYAGRGAGTEVTYTFNPDILPAPSADVVALLTKRGFTLARAQVLAAQHGRAAVADAARRFDTALARGVKPRSHPALFSNILANPGSYPLDESPALESTVKLPGSRAPSPCADPQLVVSREERLKGGLIALLGQFDDSEPRRALRDRAVTLYADGKVGILDLSTLLGRATEDAHRIVRMWEVG